MWFVCVLQVCWCSKKPEGLGFPGLRVTGDCDLLDVVPRTELGACVRAISAPNLQVISPASTILIFDSVCICVVMRGYAHMSAHRGQRWC